MMNIPRSKSVKSRGGTVCFVVCEVGDGGAPRGEEACRLVTSKMQKSKWSSPSNGHHCAALKCDNNGKNHRDLILFSISQRPRKVNGSCPLYSIVPEIHKTLSYVFLIGHIINY